MHFIFFTERNENFMNVNPQVLAWELKASVFVECSSSAGTGISDVSAAIVEVLGTEDVDGPRAKWKRAAKSVAM